jgi:hypothetical protein
MTIAIREQVVRAFAALLSSIEDEHGDAVTVERGRDTPASEFPCLVIAAGSEQGREESYGQQDLTMTVEVYGYVQQAAQEGDVDAAGADFEAAVNDLYARTVQAVMTEPRTLGGIAVDMRFVSMTPEIAMDAATNSGSFTVVFEVDYWTSSSNPFSQSTGG